MKTLFFLVFFLASTLWGYENLPLISAGAGYIGSSPKKFMAQVEFKGRVRRTVIRPQVGLLTAEFNSYLVYGGIGLDLFLKRFLVFTPSFSPGVYFKGRGKELGSCFEFRSCAELALVCPHQKRWGVQYFHLSNAHIGYRNPGVNALVFFCSIPIRGQKSPHPEG